ncbi:MAG: replication-associated recombination protein A, partial [Clostridium sp.]|nr:replication-associated recombination protein A [Clostridium sp.]
AFIESMCGSDADAAIYYLARMLSAGEDVKFIARRMMIAASEEVGNADPMAICVAAAAAQAVERTGMPEGRIILAQAAAYIASAPKSNSAYLGIDKAMKVVRETGNLPIPPYLQDSSYKGAAKLGRGVGYKYAHNYPNHWVEQQYLPDAIKDMRFYEPNDIGHEQVFKEYFRKIGKDPERYQYKDPAEEGNPDRPWEE